MIKMESYEQWLTDRASLFFELRTIDGTNPEEIKRMNPTNKQLKGLVKGLRWLYVKYPYPSVISK